MIRVQLEDFQGALEDLNHAIRQNPPAAALLLSRGMLYCQLERFDEAIADYDEAHRLDPKLAEALVARGMCWTQMKHFDRALDDYNAALRLGNDNPEAYYQRGSMFQKQGKYRGARNDYEKAALLTADNPTYHNQLAWMLATCPQDDVRDGKKAIEHATKACELTKWQDGNNLDTLAAGYAECGRFGEAVEYCQKAVAVAPENLRGEIREHIELFRSRKAVRAKPAFSEAPLPLRPGKKNRRR